MTFQHFKIYCDIATSQSIIHRAIKVSLIVGTVLNLINQGDNLLHLNLEDLSILKLGLTYLVPYSVTTYTATSMQVEFRIGTKAIIESDIECKKCHTSVHLQENELIPECANCGISTKWKLK